jgi:NAD(P)-dependent dehydrogenase (short-subunit alcohol dehydrogenase family)
MVGLVGKAVFITGAGSGIGAATAQEVVRRGGRVALVDANADAVGEVAARLGDAAWHAPVDVTAHDELLTAVAAASGWAEGFDAVVANAAVNHVARITDVEVSDFDRVVAVNLGGAVRTVLAVLPQLRRAEGYVLLVCSGSGLVQGPYQAADNASKAGLHAFGNTIRQELAQDGVRVGVAYLNAIATQAAFTAMRDPLMTPLGVEKLMRPWPVGEAAAAITDAIARRSRTVYVPGQARLAAAQPALFQRVTDRWVGRRLAGATRKAPDAHRSASQSAL